MEPPTIQRQRLVRDYSSEGMLAPSTRRRASPPPAVSPGRDRHRFTSPAGAYASPQRTNMSHANERPQSPDDLEALRKLDFSLDPVDEQDSSYEPSIATQHTTASGSSTSRLADFFGAEVFQIVLHNPTTAHQLKKYADTRLCGENLDFLEKVDQYHHSLNQVTKNIFDIHRNFISVTAPNQVNLPDDVLLSINKNLKQLLAKTVPSMEAVFLTAQNDIQKLVASDIYPRFVRHQMTTSATKALATNKNKYAGLGDCFVLTDPNKADNPIVFASDGFVKVTGYERNDIIPRNCRFLQTRRTDRSSVSRIKKSLEDRTECVELLLNERKNGEPFWNLLYTTPLYDPSGKLAFFLGGQINISTTIHNTSDILRILSFGEDKDEDEPKHVAPPLKVSRQSSFFGFSRSKKPPTSRTPGMENELLEEMDKNNLSFRQQKEAFYTAYSKYIIVDANTLTISFYSAGITDLLYPGRALGGQTITSIPGQDIFRFLAQHSPNGLSRDFKTRAKGAVKAGQAISLDVTLASRRSLAGSEVFVTHWTMLKDVGHGVGFVVVTLGGVGDVRRG